MTFTYDLDTRGRLILRADCIEREAIKEIISQYGTTYQAEAEALEHLIANSELDWIAPEEISALTNAPILGLRDNEGNPTNAWAFMDYQIRSFLNDLVKTGEAIFIS